MSSRGCDLPHRAHTIGHRRGDTSTGELDGTFGLCSWDVVTSHLRLTSSASEGETLGPEDTMAQLSGLREDLHWQDNYFSFKNYTILFPHNSYVGLSSWDVLTSHLGLTLSASEGGTHGPEDMMAQLGCLREDLHWQDNCFFLQKLHCSLSSQVKVVLPVKVFMKTAQLLWVVEGVNSNIGPTLSATEGEMPRPEDTMA